VRPQAGLDAFTAFLRAHLPASALASADLPELYEKYGTDKFNFNDCGYLAHVHPLELWLLNFRGIYPAASLDQVLASAAERQQAYRWLFEARSKSAQDERILTLLEIDAFHQIHQAWRALGYPFDSLVPSYATAIGVSGDTPQALASLAGILVNQGARYPVVRIEQLHIAQATPFETLLTRQPAAGQRVLSPLIAKLVAAGDDRSGSAARRPSSPNRRKDRRPEQNFVSYGTFATALLTCQDLHAAVVGAVVRALHGEGQHFPVPRHLHGAVLGHLSLNLARALDLVRVNAFQRDGIQAGSGN